MIRWIVLFSLLVSIVGLSSHSPAIAASSTPTTPTAYEKMGEPIHAGTSIAVDDSAKYALPIRPSSDKPNFLRNPDLSNLSLSSPTADNTSWERQFGFPGSFYIVEGLGASKKNVYASSFFTGEMGKLKVNGHVAYWDGGAWHGMGKGISTVPSSIHANANGDDVYMCGGFEGVDGRDINGIVKWNETTLTWSAVGSGVGPRDDVGNTNSVNCTTVTTLNKDVFIGGGFEKVDSTEAYNVAKWDGAQWSAVGYGVYYDPTGKLGAVYALGALPDGKLVVGGKFTHVYLNNTDNTKTAMSNIALWDPIAKKFLPMGSGLSSPPSEITVAGNDVYVGGGFTKAGGITVNGIARWDGSQWNALGAGLGSGSISSMAYYNSALYIGGSFGSVGGVNAHRVAKWDGTTWVGLDTTQSNEDSVSGLVITEDGTVYLAGEFDTFSGLAANNIARWTEAEQKWRTLGNGIARNTLSGDVTAMHMLPNGKVLVAGDYAYAAGKRIDNLATWDPTTKDWAEWQGGADGTVSVIVRNGDLLYFGGGFTKIGGISAPHIATYNLVSGQWSSLGTGLDGSVFTIAFAPDGIVYVGGVFTATPNGPADRFALYNPATQTWSAPPFEFDFVSAFYRPRVLALVPDSEGVLIGGSFFRLRINGTFTDKRINGLFYWNRKTGTLTQFGNGAVHDDDLLGSINAIVPMPDGTFYVGGRFDKIGAGVAANNAAYLGKGTWQPMGTGVNITGPNTPYVLDMRRTGNLIYVGGTFFTAGNTDSGNAAAWNIATGQWEALGDGIYGGDLDSQVNAIVIGPNAVYFGGQFHFAGAGQASSFATWNVTANQPPPPTNLDKKVFLPMVVK